MLRNDVYKDLDAYRRAVGKHLAMAFNDEQFRYDLISVPRNDLLGHFRTRKPLEIGKACKLEINEVFKHNEDGTVSPVEYSYGFKVNDLHCRYELDPDNVAPHHPLLHLHIEPNAPKIRFPTHELDPADYVLLVVNQLKCR